MVELKDCLSVLNAHICVHGLISMFSSIKTCMTYVEVHVPFKVKFLCDISHVQSLFLKDTSFNPLLYTCTLVCRLFVYYCSVVC